MSWICPKCETENPERLKVCEVCDLPRESSAVDKLKGRLKEKYSDAAYKSFIRYHYALLDAADKGDVSAQYQVAEWFIRRGSADSSNEYSKIAAEWYRKAAMKGHIDSQIKIASCYEEGRGVPQIKDEALKWYQKASLEGDEKAAQKYLKLKYSNKTYKQVILYRPRLLAAADRGNRNSQYLLGEWFSCHNSQFSYREEAFFWYEKAAKNGHGDAMFKLGDCYENGFGVYSNYNEAIKWYTKAAKGGNDSARLRLAKAYLYGNMVTKDVKEAIKWYGFAGKGISGADLCYIGYSYDVGDGVLMNKGKAMEYYRKAAEKGDSIGQYNLGVCYENGSGVAKNIFIAKNWYEKAASQGHSQAQQCIERINLKIKSQKQEETIGAIVLGSMFGSMGYYLIDNLPEWGVQLPEVWTDSFPTNLIICIIISIIGFSILIKTDE